MYTRNVLVTLVLDSFFRTYVSFMLDKSNLGNKQCFSFKTGKLRN